MAAMIVKHRVADFDAWKKVFESMTGMRKEHGWTHHTVLRDANDPNLVTVINRMRDLSGAKGYAARPELREAMKNAGVQGPPEITFLEDAIEHAY
jgi:quinol monooxygenase YgiN